MAGSARKGAFACESKVSESEMPWSRGTVSSELSMLRIPHPWQDIGKEIFLFDFFYALEIVNANSIAVY